MQRSYGRLVSRAAQRARARAPRRLAAGEAGLRPARAAAAQRASWGGLGETSAVPQGRAESPRCGVLGRARISNQYERSLRPCLAPPIAPLRRATFRQTLLALGAFGLGGRLHRRAR